MKTSQQILERLEQAVSRANAIADAVKGRGKDGVEGLATQEECVELIGLLSNMLFVGWVTESEEALKPLLDAVKTWPCAGVLERLL